MKLLKTNINLIYIILSLVFSCINIGVYLLDFEFMPVSYTAFTVIFAAVFILHAAAALKYKSEQTKASVICAWFIPLSAVIFSGTLTFSLSMPEYTLLHFELLLTAALASGFVVFFNSIKTKKIKILTTVLNALWVIPLLAVMVISLLPFALFGAFGKREITQELYSPDGTYYAWVVNSDQGTFVYARNVKRDKNILIGTLKTEDILIKHEDWTQVYSLHWEDNEMLWIDSEKYYAPKSWQS